MPFSDKELFEATKEGKVDIIISALSEDSTVANKELNNEGYKDSILAWAMFYGQIEITKLLILFDANLNYKNKSNRNPMEEHIFNATNYNNLHNQTEMTKYVKRLADNSSREQTLKEIYAEFSNHSNSSIKNQAIKKGVIEQSKEILKEKIYHERMGTLWYEKTGIDSETIMNIQLNDDEIKNDRVHYLSRQQHFLWVEKAINIRSTISNIKESKQIDVSHRHLLCRYYQYLITHMFDYNIPTFIEEAKAITINMESQYGEKLLQSGPEEKVMSGWKMLDKDEKYLIFEEIPKSRSFTIWSQLSKDEKIQFCEKGTDGPRTYNAIYKDKDLSEDNKKSYFLRLINNNQATIDTYLQVSPDQIKENQAKTFANFVNKCADYYLEKYGIDYLGKIKTYLEVLSKLYSSNTEITQSLRNINTQLGQYHINKQDYNKYLGTLSKDDFKDEKSSEAHKNMALEILKKGQSDAAQKIWELLDENARLDIFNKLTLNEMLAARDKLTHEQLNALLKSINTYSEKLLKIFVGNNANNYFDSKAQHEFIEKFSDVSSSCRGTAARWYITMKPIDIDKSLFYIKKVIENKDIFDKDKIDVFNYNFETLNLLNKDPDLKNDQKTALNHLLLTCCEMTLPKELDNNEYMPMLTMDKAKEYFYQSNKAPTGYENLFILNDQKSEPDAKYKAAETLVELSDKENKHQPKQASIQLALRDEIFNKSADEKEVDPKFAKLYFNFYSKKSDLASLNRAYRQFSFLSEDTKNELKSQYAVLCFKIALENKDKVDKSDYFKYLFEAEKYACKEADFLVRIKQAYITSPHIDYQKALNLVKDTIANDSKTFQENDLKVLDHIIKSSATDGIKKEAAEIILEQFKQNKIIVNDKQFDTIQAIHDSIIIINKHDWKKYIDFLVEVDKIKNKNDSIIQFLNRVPNDSTVNSLAHLGLGITQSKQFSDHMQHFVNGLSHFFGLNQDNKVDHTKAMEEFSKSNPDKDPHAAYWYARCYVEVHNEKGIHDAINCLSNAIKLSSAIPTPFIRQNIDELIRFYQTYTEQQANIADIISHYYNSVFSNIKEFENNNYRMTYLIETLKHLYSIDNNNIFDSLLIKLYKSANMSDKIIDYYKDLESKKSTDESTEVKLSEEQKKYLRDSNYNLGIKSHSNNDAYSYFKKAADLGHINAMFKVAELDYKLNKDKNLSDAINNAYNNYKLAIEAAISAIKIANYDLGPYKDSLNTTKESLITISALSTKDEKSNIDKLIASITTILDNDKAIQKLKIKHEELKQLFLGRIDRTQQLKSLINESKKDIASQFDIALKAKMIDSLPEIKSNLEYYRDILTNVTGGKSTTINYYNSNKLNFLSQAINPYVQKDLMKLSEIRYFEGRGEKCTNRAVFWAFMAWLTNMKKDITSYLHPKSVSNKNIINKLKPYQVLCAKMKTKSYNTFKEALEEIQNESCIKDAFKDENIKIKELKVLLYSELKDTTELNSNTSLSSFSQSSSSSSSTSFYPALSNSRSSLLSPPAYTPPKESTDLSEQSQPEPCAPPKEPENNAPKKKS